jgi:hypothetical protein
MAKLPRDAITERFVIGRKAAEKISAVEGLTRSSRIRHLIELSDRHGESGDQRRARIRAEFAKK